MLKNGERFETVNIENYFALNISFHAISKSHLCNFRENGHAILGGMQFQSMRFQRFECTWQVDIVTQTFKNQLTIYYISKTRHVPKNPSIKAQSQFLINLT